MFDLASIQAALADFGLDGWLLADFRGNNPLACRILEFPENRHATRRMFYCIPKTGEPRKLVHRIESTALDHLPGEKDVYLRWQELEQGLARLLQGMDTVAMEYSPRNAIPYVSRVDAGIVELVRSMEIDVVSSGDLIQRFEAAWDDAQWALHLEAEEHTTAAFDMAFGLIADRIRSTGTVEELEVQAAILDHFTRCGMVTDHPPIVAVGPNSGNPHYETGTGQNTVIGRENLVMVDLWAKLDRPRAVYSDLTRMVYTGKQVPEKYAAVFQIVAQARDAAIDFIKDAMASDRVVQGWEVDRTCRRVIEDAGYGEAFVHRTGHSIGQETHGNGANMDDLETHDERRVLPRTCFSIEPGIYLPEFGIRSEVNVFIAADKTVHVTGGPVQTEIGIVVSG